MTRFAIQSKKLTVFSKGSTEAVVDILKNLSLEELKQVEKEVANLIKQKQKEQRDKPKKDKEKEEIDFASDFK